MKKIIIFSMPAEITDKEIISKLTESLNDLNVQSHAVILTENDLTCTTKQTNPAIVKLLKSAETVKIVLNSI